jgi:CRISPR/Cas system-associated endonuclease/helicase Cas3
VHGAISATLPEFLPQGISGAAEAGEGREENPTKKVSIKRKKNFLKEKTIKSFYLFASS